MERLAAYLRQQRQSHGYDVRTLVGKSGVTNAQISRIENGKSQISMEALVRLAFGLNIQFKDILVELIDAGDVYLHTYQGCLTYMQVRNSLEFSREPIPLASELSTFVSLYRDQPQKVEEILVDGLSEIYNRPNPPLSEETVENQINQAIHSDTGEIIPLPYPQQDILLDQVYAGGGVITLNDLAQVIRMERAKSGMSLRNYANEQISYSTIGRIERGFVGRLLFSQVLELDGILGTEGKLPAYAWEAEEYETGIGLKMDKWEPVEKAAADAFITICRWRYVQGGDQTWWKNNVAKQ